MNAKLENIIDLLEHYGVERKPFSVEVDMHEKLRDLRTLAAALLKNRHMKYEPVTDIEGTILDWIYLQGRHPESFFTKGILFKGPIGSGKTFAMTLLQYLLNSEKQQFVFNATPMILSLTTINAARLVEIYLIDPESTLEKYTKLPALCIDDLGSEPEATSYGNKVNIIQRILYTREESGSLTFATTNMERFSGVYDDRTVSRMNSLFNVVILNGSDRRKMR